MLGSRKKSLQEIEKRNPVRSSLDSLSRARLKGGQRTYLESSDIVGAVPKTRHLVNSRRSNPVMPVY